MKKILTVIILLFAVNSYSQFAVSTSLGQGIRINDELNYTLYQTAISIQAGYTFEKFTLNTVSTSVLTDSVTSYYTGLMPSVNVWNKSEKNINISGLFLAGMNGGKLVGIGSGYQTDKITFGINAMRELKLNETWIEAVLGFNIYKEK